MRDRCLGLLFRREIQLAAKNGKSSLDTFESEFDRVWRRVLFVSLSRYRLLILPSALC